MQGRAYTTKAKAKMFVESLDDEKYASTTHQCMIDLNIATMMSDHVIQKL